MNFMEYQEVRKWSRDRFPREAGLKREFVHDMRELINYIGCQGYTDCFASVFGLAQWEQNIYDTVLLDVDGGYGDLQRVLTILDEVGLPNRRVYFTGRGFHVYIDFPEHHIDNYGKRVRMWAEDCLLTKYVDRHVLGDKRRMARIPYTKNSKTGLYCVGIDENMSFEEIESNARMSIVTPVYVKKTDLWKWLLEYDVSENGDVEKAQSAVKKCPKMPSCIAKIIDDMLATREMSHERRLLLGTFLLKFMNVDDAIDVFRPLSDFSESYTRYQLEWLKNNKYEPYSCKRIKEFGLCDEKCEYFPWVGRKEIWSE